MRHRLLLCWIAMFLASMTFGASAPALQSPVGSGTQVPSAGRTGAIRTPNPMYGLSGNLSVTGNIGGGRHFRGVVPYSSYSYSGAGLNDSGALGISNFLRRSSDPNPFYDPRRTVSSLNRAGRSGLQMPNLGSQGRNTYAASQDWLDSFDYATSLAPSNRPLTPTTSPLQKALSQRISPNLNLSERPDFPLDAAKNLEIKIPSAESALETSRPKPLKPIRLQEEKIEQPQELTIYQEIAKNLFQEFQEKSEKAEEDAEQTSNLPNLPETKLPDPDPSENEKAGGQNTPQISLEQVQQGQARREIKEYGSFSSLAQARYSQYMSKGQELLKNGQYYQAADAFELAEVWRPQDAVALLARSHALFVAGEYMSSALYLNFAILHEPKLAQAKADLAALIDDRDVFEERLGELTEWQQKSESGELAFLTAYVLFQDGKIQRARDLISFAQGRMEDSQAVNALQKAIESAANAP